MTLESVQVPVLDVVEESYDKYLYGTCFCQGPHFTFGALLGGRKRVPS